jgi:predicted transcriptional regulator
MSFQPQWAASILREGTQFELRRTRCGCFPGTNVLVYTSAKVRKVTGAFVAGRVLGAPLAQLYEQVRGRCGVSEEDFYFYLDGLERGWAIEVLRPRLVTPFELRDSAHERVRGPMSFRYLDAANSTDARFLAAAGL